MRTRLIAILLAAVGTMFVLGCNPDGSGSVDDGGMDGDGGGSGDIDRTVDPCELPTGVFFTDVKGGVIRRMNPDGTGSEALVSEGIDPDCIAIDLQRGHMYWTHDDVAIMRANLDGSSVETILSDLPSPYCLDLDLVNDRIYWTNQIDSPKIQSARQDGSDVQDLVPGSGCCTVGISLDLVGGKMYWMDGYYEGSVMRADLDGSNVEAIATTVGIANGIDVDVDSGKVYWTEYGNGSEDDVVRRANLDGSEVELLLDRSDGLETPGRIAVDPAGQKIYFADLHTGRILRANLDGSGLETLWTGDAHTRGVALERNEPCR